MRERIRLMVLPAIKTAVGAMLAVALANMLGLTGSMTAGIIAVLSIRSTKRETWRMAVERVLGFVCALACAWVCMQALGYTLTGFAVYLFFYAVLCIAARWEHALTPVSVLVTHFVLAGGMPAELIVNEALLLLIGSGMGVLINLTLRPNAARMADLTATMDQHMVAALHALADDPCGDAPFDALELALRKAADMAERNRANRLLGDDSRAVDYVRARREQYETLLRMRRELCGIAERPPQYGQVCELLRTVAAQYRYDNDVQALLELQAALLADMRTQPLPVTRVEFESRAVLYGVLLELEQFLRIKRMYYDAYLRR